MSQNFFWKGKKLISHDRYPNKSDLSVYFLNWQILPWSHTDKLLLYLIQMPFLQGVAEEKVLPSKTFDGEGDLFNRVPAASDQHQTCTSRSRVDVYAKWRQEQAERNKKRKFNGNGDDSAKSRKRISPAVQVNTLWGTRN